MQYHTRAKPLSWESDQHAISTRSWQIAIDIDHILPRFPTWVICSGEVRFSRSNPRKRRWRQKEINQKSWPEEAADCQAAIHVSDQ